MKRNREYWRNRFDLLEQTMNDIAQDTYLNLEKAFEKAQAKLNREIAYWVDRFADNNKVSLEEARKMLNANELREFRWSVEEYVKYGEENNVNGLWIKQLKNASARHHISRLEAMKIQTQQIIEGVYDEELSSTEGMIKNIYSQNYYRSIYEIQKAFGIGFVVNKIDESKLNTFIHKPWAPDGQNFSDRIWRNKTQMVNELHKEMVRIAVTGEHPRVVIDKMKKYVDKKYRTAKRQASTLVMTECAFFSSASQGEAFKNLGVEKFEVVATLDTLTSEICQEMDGKVFPEELREPGVTCNPLHVGCRSTTCPYFDDEFTEGEMRAARGEDGKVYYVPTDMHYPEWHEKFVKSKEPFYENTNRWKKVSPNRAKKVTDLNEYEHNGVVYKVDGVHVILDYTQHEKEVGDLFAREYGKKVEMIPRILKPSNIKTADYLFDGIEFDLKTIEGSGKNTIYDAIKNGKKQANKFIVDLDRNKTTLTSEKVEEQIAKVFNSTHTENVDEIIVIENLKIIKAFKRK